MIEILLFIWVMFALYIVIKYAVKHAIIEAMIVIKDDRKDDDLSLKNETDGL